MSHEGHEQKSVQRSRSSIETPEQQLQVESGQIGSLSLQRAYADPSSLTPKDIKRLQRTIGNQATIGVLSRSMPIQARLKLGPAGDKYEDEADRVAEQVVRQIAQPQRLQRLEEEDERVQAKPLLPSISTLQRAPAPPIRSTFSLQRAEGTEAATQDLAAMHGPEGGNVEESVARQISAAQGGGRPLDDSVRGAMESGFGANFANVRIHTGGEADTLNRSLNARAFTVGSDIFFRGGEYNPGSTGGQKLLAHELTHTIQQGGAQRQIQTERPAQVKRTLQRKPSALLTKPLKARPQPQTPEIQRFSFSSLFKRKKKQDTGPVTISGPTDVQLPDSLSNSYKQGFKDVGSGQDIDEASILDMQANARISAQDSLSRASTLSVRAKTKGRELREAPEVSDKDPDMMRARKDVDTKSDIKRGQRADATVHAFTVDAEKQFDEILSEIASLKDQVDQNNTPVTDLAVVDKDLLAAHHLATQSQQAAVMAQKKANDLAERVRSLEDQAKLEAAKTRSGLQKPGEFGKEVSWGKLEMSASDAALRIEAHKADILSLYLYMKADLGVVTNYMQQRARSLSKTYGKGTVAKIMASGYSRGRSMGIAKPLSDDAALDLLNEGELSDGSDEYNTDVTSRAEEGNEFAQTHQLDQRETPTGKGNKYLDPSLEQGKWSGLKSWVGDKASTVGSTIGSGVVGGVKTLTSPFRAMGRGLDRKVFRRDNGKRIAKAREIQGLELMSLFYTQARKRFEDAEKFAGASVQQYEAALATYDGVDAAKKEHEKGNHQDINPHVLKVGKSWEDVMQAASNRAKLKDYKDQVAKESAKYSKFGERAMSGAKSIGYTIAGLGGTIVKTLTGGLVGWEKVDKDGGYSAGLKLTTIWDEIKKIWAEFKAIYATFKGKGLRGLGGKIGAIIYSILKITSVVLGVIRSLASAVALWSTIAAAASMGGAGSVTAVATSISLYAAVAKAVIDAVLLVWSIIASKKTADPRSRSKLRGDIARHGLGLGESLATVAGAGLSAGLSGDFSAFTGGWMPGREGLSPAVGAFGKHGESSSSQLYNAINDNWSQNIGGKEFYFSEYLRTGANVGVGQTGTVGNLIGSGIAGAIEDDNIRQMNIDKNKDLKVAAKEAKGQTKDAKGKMAKFADKVKVGVYDMTHFWRTPTEKRREQKQEMGRMFDELALAVENINAQNQAIDEDSALEDDV